MNIKLSTFYPETDLNCKSNYTKVLYGGSKRIKKQHNLLADKDNCNYPISAI